MVLNYRSFFIFLVLFAIEVCIAVFLKRGFIRFVFGDFLVVIMLYYFLKSFIRTKPLYCAIAVLLFAFAIELLQLSNLLKVLGLEEQKLANLILGNTFEITDLIAYTLGIFTVLLIEKKQHYNSVAFNS